MAFPCRTGGDCSGWMILTLLAALVSGCATAPKSPNGDVLFFVVGAGGDGVWYGDAKRELTNAGQSVVTVRWGAPLVAFLMNFTNRDVHDRAETNFAARLIRWRHDHPAARIDILAHSAGGGVTLGALRRLPEAVRVDRVVLLHPSVSPTYDLAAAAKRINDGLHVFSSTRDTLYLSWRTSNFSTYDGVKTVAAGNAGFADAKNVIAHPYDPAWQALGYDGGHFSCTSRNFTRAVVAPLLCPPTPMPVEPERSVAASGH